MDLMTRHQLQKNMLLLRQKRELKGRNKKIDSSIATLLTNIESELVDFERFSSANRVTRDMAYVLIFVRCVRATNSIYGGVASCSDLPAEVCTAESAPIKELRDLV